MISEADKERVREATDIIALISEDVELKPSSGDDYVALCPFHEDRNPSFHVRASLGRYHCFGCGEDGDVFSYIQRRENLDFPDAIRYLADRAHIEIHEVGRPSKKGPSRTRVYKVLAETAKYYHALLMRGKDESCQRARQYMADRKMNASVCERFCLGYAPGKSLLVRHLHQMGFSDEEMLAADVARHSRYGLDDRFFNRIIFPILDEIGQVIGFGGRVMDDSQPKYLNSKDSSFWHKSKKLFGFNKAKDAIKQTGCVIICEGYVDTIALHEAGFTNAVAVLGTALTQNHIKLLGRLKPKRIIMLLDGDAAGQRAQEKAIQFIDETPAALLSVCLPHNMDPKEYLDAKGASALKKKLEEARPLIDDILDRHLSKVDLSVSGDKARAIEELALILAPLLNSVSLRTYAMRIADYLSTDVSYVLQKVKEAARKQLRFSRNLNATNNAYGLEKESGGNDELSTTATKDMQTLQAPSKLVLRERALIAGIVEDPKRLQDSAQDIALLELHDEFSRTALTRLRALPTNASSQDVLRQLTSYDAGAPEMLSQASLEQTSLLWKPLLLAVLVSQKKEALGKLRAHLASSLSDEETRNTLAHIAQLQNDIHKLEERLVETE